MGLEMEGQLAVPIYYELQGLLDEASGCKERLKDPDEDLSLAVKGIKKYKKNLTFINASVTHYTALILDSRVKGNLLLEELDDEDTERRILQPLCDSLRRGYSVSVNIVGSARSRTSWPPLLHKLTYSSISAGAQYQVQ